MLHLCVSYIQALVLIELQITFKVLHLQVG